MTSRTEDLGELSFDGQSLSLTYASETYGAFSCAVADLAVIGEFSTESGPFCEDVFSVFVLKTGSWFEIPFGAKGRTSTFEKLSDAIGGVNLDSRLHFETTFRSIVLWPAELQGSPLFTFESSVIARIIGLGSVRHRLSAEVVRFLNCLSAAEGNT